MYAKRSRRYASKKRPARRPVRRARPARKSIAKIVKSIISRQAENKCWFDYGANQSFACNILTAPQHKNLVPVLSQGTGHSGRVGNEIRVKRATVRGFVNILPYDVTINNQPQPTYIKIWLLSCKTINTTNLASTPIASSFHDIVNSSVGLQGNMLDMTLTQNKDEFVIHASKTFKLGAGYASSTGPVTSLSYFDNSPFSVPFSFNFGKHLKTVKYSDGATAPTNKNLFIAFQCVPANGATGTSQIMAEYYYATRVEYEDM